MATLIKADGTTREVFPKAGLSFTLQEMQQYVGGYVQIVYAPDDIAVLCNEDGKILRMPFNFAATEKYARLTGLAADDYFSGDVLVCTAEETGEDKEETE